MEDQIINRVAASPLVTFDLEELYVPGERVLFDIKDLLFHELILREKDFREFIRTHDWSLYKDKMIAVTCTADAIVPTWAYMLLSVALQPCARRVIFGNLQQLESILYSDALKNVDWELYRGGKVVVKGCSKVEVPVSAYVEATAQLRQVCFSIMYGEPCSTVPLFKKGR